MKGKIIKFIIFIAVVAVLAVFNVMMNSNAKIEHAEGEESGHDHGGGPKILDATLEMGKVLTFETEKGSFDIVLLQKDIRNSTKMFLKLAKGKKYNNVKFTEVKDWMIKSDFANADTDPLETETAYGLSTYRGAVCLAKGNKSHDSVSSFFVIKECSPSCGEYFTVIGYVVKGMENVDKIAENDTIKSVSVRKATDDDEKELIALFKQGKKDSKEIAMIAGEAEQKIMQQQMGGAPAPDMVN